MRPPMSTTTLALSDVLVLVSTWRVCVVSECRVCMLCMLCALCVFVCGDVCLCVVMSCVVMCVMRVSFRSGVICV